MIVAFPDPYPDELLYSTCARYYDRVQYPNKQVLLRELFGRTSATATIDMPTHIDHLIKSLPTDHRWTSDRLIEEHTLFPLLSPFLPSDRAEQLRMDMRRDGGMLIHKRAGIMASGIPLPDHLRFCPLCSQDDEKQFGEFYWHRLHQIPGIEVCPIHIILLEQSGVCIRFSRLQGEFVSANRNMRYCSPRPFNTFDPRYRTLLNIACNTNWLLRQRNLKSSLTALHNRYLFLLMQQGFASFSGRIYANKLLGTFTKYYAPDFLGSLHCSLKEKEDKKDNWLLRLMRNKKNAQHPLRHLLMMDFLGCTADEFFKLPEEIKFFGDPPWPCLNCTANHYQQPIITNCYVRFRGKNHRPTGTFSCTCGFIYTRTGPDASSEDRYRISRMKEFGPVWEGALKNRWIDQSLSINKIARLQGVDPLTIKRYATRLGLTPYRHIGGSIQSKLKSDYERKETPIRITIKRENYREMWLSGMDKNPCIEMKDLRSKLPRVYVWLLENDKKWLAIHRPLSQKRKISNTSNIDWKSRDVEIAIRVRSAALRLKNLTGRPKRITFTGIGKELGLLGLIMQKLSKLPLTKETLSSVVESPIEFAIRRVWYIAMCYVNEGIIPQRWQLVDRACLFKYSSVPEVRDAINAALASINTKTRARLVG